MPEPENTSPERGENESQADYVARRSRQAREEARKPQPGVIRAGEPMPAAGTTLPAVAMSGTGTVSTPAATGTDSPLKRAPESGVRGTRGSNA